jgi:hypothetical protein
MKPWLRRTIFLAACLLLALSGPPRVRAQEPDEAVLKSLEAAFAGGDVEALLKRSATRLEVAIFGESRLYSRSQARYVLRDFFEERKPERFAFSASSKTNGGWFAEGEYWYSRAERPLRVYMRLRQNGTAWELREVLIAERSN